LNFFRRDWQTPVQKNRPFRLYGVAKGLDVAFLIDMDEQSGVAIVELLDKRRDVGVDGGARTRHAIRMDDCP
jgi:hypothetical protein